jgi:hypothetical protein
MQKLLQSALFPLFALGLLGVCKAQGVRINEVVYDDSSRDSREFVELYNSGGKAVDISGWKILSEDKDGPNKSYTIPKNTLLPAGGFFVLGSPLVPKVNLILGNNDLFENDNESLTLVDGSRRVIDSLIYESNKGVWNRALTEGDSIFGNFISIDQSPSSWSRFRDGESGGLGLSFVLLPTSPGRSNNLPAARPLAEDFDKLSEGREWAAFGASFRRPRVVNPQKQSRDNPHILPASPQGGLALVSWDSRGGGNANFLLQEVPSHFVLEAYVYIQAQKTQGKDLESWSIGIGTTDSFHAHPDPAGILGGGSNGNTGLALVYQRSARGTWLYLVDHGDGGWGKAALSPARILGNLSLLPGKDDGWKRLRLERRGLKIRAFFGGTPGCADGKSLEGSLQSAPWGSLYLGYQGSFNNRQNAWPLTLDALNLDFPSDKVLSFGTAKATTQGTPKLSANLPPLPGETRFALQAEGLVPGSTAFYTLSFKKLKTPLDLGLFGGQKGALLYLENPFLFLRKSSSKGGSILPLPLPCNPKLKGVSLYFQLLDLDPGLKKTLPFGTSQGLELRLGG